MHDDVKDLTRDDHEHEVSTAGDGGDEVATAADGGDASGDAAGAPSTFAELGLSDRILEALERRGYREPTPIQIRALPPALAGKDVLGSAHTGTGKTAAFALPMIQRLSEGDHGTLRGLVITPTRELARQVEEATAAYGSTSSVETMVVHGGVPIQPQIDGLAWGCDILMATPGRLLDHLRRGTVDLSSIEVLVLDEADRMLDMGFIDDIRKIVQAIPSERQTFLFSATMPNAILSLAHEMMGDERVRVKVGLETAAEGIREVIHPVDRAAKHELLLHLLRGRTSGQILVFTRTRATASYLSDYLLGEGLSVDDLHGGKSQQARTKSLGRFREGDTRILVATNVAARGLDIRGIRHVINFDVPEDPRDYVHRVGRTARADETGDAITLMSPHEWLRVRDIESLMDMGIDRSAVQGFEPSVEPLAARQEPEEEEADAAPRSRLGRGRRRR